MSSFNHIASLGRQPELGLVELESLFGAAAVKPFGHQAALVEPELDVSRLGGSVKVGTVFERSKIGLPTWLYAVHLLTSSKKGFSAHQLHRTLKVTYKTAWFMAHRIREAMSHNEVLPPMGGGRRPVQADETYYGNTSKRAKSYKKGHSHKASIVALIDENTKTVTGSVLGLIKRRASYQADYGCVLEP